MTGWAIPQDNRIAHTNMEQSKQAKYCFNLPNNAEMLRFNKLTGEHNAKKYFKKVLFLWEYIFKTGSRKHTVCFKNENSLSNLYENKKVC